MQDEADPLRLRNLIAPVIAGSWGQDTPTRAAPVAARVIRNGDVPSSRRIAVEELPVRWFQRREVAKAETRASDTVVVSSGYIGKSANPPHSDGSIPVVVSNFVRLLRPKGGTDPRWLFHVLGSTAVLQAMHRNAGGSTIVNLSSGYLDEPLDLLHADLPEQRRIAEILDTLDEAIRKAEQVIAKLQQMKQGLLHDLLTRGIDENGELRDPGRHPERFKDSLLGRIPKPWAVASLDDACDAVVDCPHSTPEYLEHGVLVARTTQVRDGRYDVEGSSRVTEKEYLERVSRLEPMPGDVILTREAPVGEAFTIPLGMRICLGQRVMLLRPSPSRALGEYLVAQVYSGVVRRRIGQLTGGTTNPHLNVGEVKAFQIPLPRVEEQTHMVSRLDELDGRLHLEATQVAKLRTLKQGLMDDLLTGRVRVPRPEAATA